MAKVLITGGAGFIGSNLTDMLVEKGYEVLVLDNLSSGKKENINPKAKFYNADIRDERSISPIFKGVDFVFHLAAIPRVPISVQDPIGTSEVNIMGSLNVFNSARKAGVKRVVFASSSSVYGNQKKMPLKENMEASPVSPYGLQKFVGEKFAGIFSNLYNLSIVSLRYFNVYGPRIDYESNESLVIGKFLRQKQEGKPFTICGDGKQTRGFCFVDDVNEANILAMESKKIKGGEVVNIGSKKSYSVNEIADLIDGEKQYLPKRKGDVLHTKADIGLAKKLLGWIPKISFEEGIEMTKKWFNNVRY